MKVKLHKLGLGLAASMVLFAAAARTCRSTSMAASTPSILWDKIVKDPYGRCIRTPWWTAEKDVPECGGRVAGGRTGCPVRNRHPGHRHPLRFRPLRAEAARTRQTRPTGLRHRRAERVSSIKIVGHTDSKGTEAYNMRLGQRRADTVASYLTFPWRPQFQHSRPAAWVNRIRSPPTPCRTARTTRKAAR
jgi:OOP family OmpA-OmpF porin